MIIPGQRSLPLSVHNRFVITFTNTDVQTRTFPHQLVASDSQTHLVFIARTNNRATHSFLGPSQHNRLSLPVLCVVVMSHPQPSCGCQPGPTGVLIHPGRADQQCASSCVVWIVVAVHSEVVIYKQKKKRQKKRKKK